MAWTKLLVLLGLVSLVPTSFAQTAQFNQPEGVDIWCGKAYRAANSSFDPGGWFKEPPVSTQPLLRLNARPRLSIYLDTDTEGTLLVDAAVVFQAGEPLPGCAVPTGGTPPLPLGLDISYNGETLKTASIDVGSVDNQIPLDLRSFEPQFDPYNITVRANLGVNKSYTATTEILRLPYPEDYGSVARLDNLYGGLYAQRGKNSGWERLFAYTYYTQWTRYWNEDEGAAIGMPNVSTIDEFVSMGYNVIHIVPTGSLQNEPFPWNELMPYIKRANELGVYLDYDVIWRWTNLTGMIEQVTELRKQPSIISWYQSDEPDGKGNPTNSTGIAYDQIKAIDPYHPVSLVLNCFDFYYEEYSKGGDIVSSDVYPISNNNTFSNMYGTVCNATYGCCGCDNCEGGFDDVSRRIDEFYRRDAFIGRQKTQWFTPMALGNETFWPRFPTAAELVVMTVLAINHGAKGIVQWNYPAIPEIEAITELMARTLTSDAMTDFTLGAPWFKTLAVEGQGAELIDVTAWVHPDNGKVLLSVINKNYGDVSGQIRVSLPDGVQAGAVEDTLWGDAEWTAESDAVVSDGLLGLQVSIFILEEATMRKV